MKTIVLLMTITISILANDIKFYTPSFDCTKVKEKSVEYKICSDEKLSQLDKELSKVYGSFYFITKEIKSDQIAWIKKRNRCKDTSCIQKAYIKRIKELNNSLKNEKTFPKLTLDAMKEAQKSMKIVWNPIIFNKKNIKAGLKFKDDLFRFRNIHFKKPLIAGVQYNNPKLKEILGVCYYYRFDLEVNEFPAKYIENGRRYWVEDKRKPLKDINVSVWKTTALDKEWYFIKLGDLAYSYLVDTNICKQKRLKNTLVDALNYNRGRVKRSELVRNNPTIVNYKNQVYIFEVLIREWYINFYILEILSNTMSKNSNIYFTGISKAHIPFKKIIKPQQGEK